MSKVVTPRTQQAFLWVGLLPVLLVALGYASRQQYRESVQLVTHERDVLDVLDDLSTGVAQAAASQRGFLLTSQPAYLAPFAEERNRALGALRRLRPMVTGNPEQLRNVDLLTPALTAEFEEMQKVLDAERSRGHAAALAIVLSDRGRILMSQIQTAVAAMRRVEGSNLSSQRSRQDRFDGLVNTLFAIAILANLMILAWTSHVVKRFVLARARSESEVRDLNESLRMQMDETERLNTALQERVYEIDRLNLELENRVKARTEELRESNEHLRRSNEDLQRFAYAASHDLQEPLRMVASFVGLLGRRYRGRLDDEADKYIAFAVDGAKRMQNLINELLRYSRAGTQQLDIRPVPLAEIINDALKNLRMSLQETGAQIYCHDLPLIMADPGKLALVFQNLVSNAIKFREQDARPEIVIQAAERDQEWQISVADNGIGFEEVFADKIFILFQRLHGPGRYPGTGIGLAICKRIVEGHGGRLWAKSKPGAGSTFFFTLPARASATQTSRSAKGG